MSAIDNSLIVPGHGTMFHADASAALPADPLSAFKLNAAPPEGWTDLGHTSRENTVSFAKEGGEQTQLDTWYSNGVRIVHSATSWTATVGALQMTEETMDLAFNGELDAATGRYIVPSTPVPTGGQTVILFQDVTDSMLFWIPNTQTVLGAAPSVNTEGFFEVQLSVSILSSTKLTLADGKTGIMAIYKDEWAPTP